MLMRDVRNAPHAAQDPTPYAHLRCGRAWLLRWADAMDTCSAGRTDGEMPLTRCNAGPAEVADIGRWWISRHPCLEATIACAASIVTSYSDLR